MRLVPRVASSVAALTAVVLTAGSFSEPASEAASGAGAPRVGDDPSRAAPASAGAAAPSPVIVVAAGDVACRPRAATTARRCQHARTAELAAALEPDAVLALGDLQYEAGSLRHFRRSYAPTWGSLRGKTYPIPGNHEYRTAGARGYYTYFDARQPGAPGYYAFDLASWRVYALNSNCGEIDCPAEYRWLRNDLVANPRACSLVMMHHPRFSSGREHGSDAGMSRFFRIAQRHDVDLVLAGHDHDYERFRRMRADGTVDRDGVMSIVSGAGGKSLYPFGQVEHGSAFRNAASFGVLRLALRAQRFRFAFKTVDGTTPDAGVRSCR